MKKQYNLLMVLSVDEEKGFLGDFVNDHSDGYIGDQFYQHADDYIDIYSYDLYKSVPDFHEYIEDALNEYGWEAADGSLIRLFQMGQGKFYEALLFENEKEVLFNIAWDLYEAHELNGKLEDEEELIELIEELAEHTETNGYMDTFKERVTDLLDEELTNLN